MSSPPLIDSEAYDFTQHIPSSTTTAHWLCTKIIHFNTPSIFHHHRHHRRYLLLLSLCYTVSFLLLFLLLLSKTPHLNEAMMIFNFVGLLKFRFLKKKGRSLAGQLWFLLQPPALFLYLSEKRRIWASPSPSPSHFSLFIITLFSFESLNFFYCEISWVIWGLHQNWGISLVFQRLLFSQFGLFVQFGWFRVCWLVLLNWV